MNKLEIDNLTKYFGKKLILSDISLKCETGEIIGVFGRNGSGKSTLLKILFGTLKANSITVKINGEEIETKGIIPSKKIAYLSQEPFLPKGLKVREVIPLFYQEEEQDQIFYAKGISKFENTLVGKLSMGELRYLEILLIGNLQHEFLLLDEPFSMVEPIMKEFLKEFLFTLKETKGIILTDHYYHDVLEVSSRNLIVTDTKIVEVASKSDLVKYDYIKKPTE
ncbi:ATP-binding cassette domain-containing protein [Flavobacterium soli]|uniref:ATP-binding cassette domain-containing protein n=1 Tax=Flavobacterium soli TaxID=344881 RepID=UPI0004267C53|nr:ATP-binding cassette domain-containing protein [Flavobacterium soli]